MFYILYQFVTCLLTLPRTLAEKCMATSVRISEGERPPGIPRRSWINNIKISLLEVGFGLYSYVLGTSDGFLRTGR
jgi:hypothetical protein